MLKPKVKYNPNHYCVLVHTKEGDVLGYFNTSNIITDTRDVILCSTGDTHKYRYFHEVLLDIASKKDYNVGSVVTVNGLSYFIIEKEELEKDVDSKDEVMYSYIVGR